MKKSDKISISCTYNDILEELQNGITNLDDLYESNYLSFDIETIRKTKTWEELSTLDQEIWTRMVTRQKIYETEIQNGKTPAEIYLDKGGLHPEFMTVVAISFGLMCNGKEKLATLTLNDGNEKEIIYKFNQLLITKKDLWLVGFNCLNFDIDVLWKKIIYYNLPMPNQINIRSIKPWDAQVIDLYLKWKGSRFDVHPSLAMVSNYLGLGTSKDAMDGSEVGTYYYVDDIKEQKRNIDLIGEYCQKDVLMTMRVFERIRKV